MKNFFNPKSIAVIGVSSDKKKIGRIIFDQLVKEFKTYPINPKKKKIAGKNTYASVSQIKEKVDLAFIAVPAKFVIQAVEDCGKKGIRNVVIVSSGFKEVGNNALEVTLLNTLTRYKIKCVGPNCLGIFDAHSKLDSLFLPVSKLPRPKKGSISFITQSGAIGSAVLDLLAYEDFGFSKFISYGNATNVSETDYLEFLGKDKNTKIICMYIEAIKDGKKFLKVAKKIKKPIIVIKGGKSERGNKATMSHTGSLAGAWQVYQGAFKQAGVILADNVEQMFHIAKLFEKLPKPKGNKVQVITNGGGYGIVVTDTLVTSKIPMAKMGKQSIHYLTAHVPKIAIVGNPLDLTGGATNKQYNLSLRTAFTDHKVDIILLVLLHQTPSIDEKMVSIVNKYKKKPLLVVSTGGKQTEALSRKIESNGTPVFRFPEQAVYALKKWLDFY